MADTPKAAKPTIAEREAQLWDVEAQIAIDILTWLDLLADLRRLSESVPAEEVVGVLRMVDRDQLVKVKILYMDMAQRRLELERDALKVSAVRSKVAAQSRGSRGLTDLRRLAVAEHKASGLGVQKFAKQFAMQHPECDWRTVKKWISRARGGGT